jgi:DEAD/DEAH box helicase domain-containing protein
MSENLYGPQNPLYTGQYDGYYGPNWNRQRNRARERAGYKCQHCGVPEKNLSRELDVHHIKPFASFEYVANENDNYKQANRLSNLVALCSSCHTRAEFGKIPVQAHLI